MLFEDVHGCRLPLSPTGRREGKTQTGCREGMPNAEIRGQKSEWETRSLPYDLYLIFWRCYERSQQANGHE
jgi:hypothetical protein